MSTSQPPPPPTQLVITIPTWAMVAGELHAKWNYLRKFQRPVCPVSVSAPTLSWNIVLLSQPWLVLAVLPILLEIAVSFVYTANLCHVIFIVIASVLWSRIETISNPSVLFMVIRCFCIAIVLIKGPALLFVWLCLFVCFVFGFFFFFFCSRSAVLRPSVHMLPGIGWCGGLLPFPTACWWLTHPAAITDVSVSARWDSPGGCGGLSVPLLCNRRVQSPWCQFASGVHTGHSVLFATWILWSVHVWPDGWLGQ